MIFSRKNKRTNSNRTESKSYLHISRYRLHDPPTISYNKEDNLMIVRSTYADMEKLKLALSQHTIRHGFKFDPRKMGM
jgi:hypothetical protein